VLVEEVMQDEVVNVLDKGEDSTLQNRIEIGKLYL